jgi:hypothetical protein
MIPIGGFLIFTNNNRSWKILGLWFIPVILIPMIWPAYAIWNGEFDKWLDGVFWQTSGREDRPLFGSLNIIYRIDPVLLVIGLTGFIFVVALKRDLFLLLWIIPFLIFLYFIGYVSYWHYILLIPVLCISGARLLLILSSTIKTSKKIIQQALPICIILGIVIFGFISTSVLIAIDLNSFYFKALALTVSSLPDNNINNKITIIGNQHYFWIPKHIFGKDYDYKSFGSKTPIKTEKYLADKRLMELISNHETKQFAVFYNDTKSRAIIEPERVNYDLKMYPYTNILVFRQDSVPNTKTDIRTNY